MGAEGHLFEEYHLCMNLLVMAHTKLREPLFLLSPQSLEPARQLRPELSSPTLLVLNTLKVFCVQNFL